VMFVCKFCAKGVSLMNRLLHDPCLQKVCSHCRLALHKKAITGSKK